MRQWITWVIVGLIGLVGLVLSIGALLLSRDWPSFVLNLGTELIGAAIVYILLDRFIGNRERSQEEKERLHGLILREEQDHGVAINAIRILGMKGWLQNGSLRGWWLGFAKLREAPLELADLREAELDHADLREAMLYRADLRDASLWNADLHGAELRDVRLQGANLEGANLAQAKHVWTAKLDGKVCLPDGTRWTPNTDMGRFTDRGHPDFWRSDNPHSPAYQGKQQ